MDKNSFKQFRRSQIAELCPYVPGEGLAYVSISEPDRQNGSPKLGDMIARNPTNHNDQWLVAAKYFADNFEPLERVASEETSSRVATLASGLMNFEPSWLTPEAADEIAGNIRSLAASCLTQAPDHSDGK